MLFNLIACSLYSQLWLKNLGWNRRNPTSTKSIVRSSIVFTRQCLDLIFTHSYEVTVKTLNSTFWMCKIDNIETKFVLELEHKIEQTTNPLQFLKYSSNFHPLIQLINSNKITEYVVVASVQSVDIWHYIIVFQLFKAEVLRISFSIEMKHKVILRRMPFSSALYHTA